MVSGQVTKIKYHLSPAGIETGSNLTTVALILGESKTKISLYLVVCIGDFSKGLLRLSSFRTTLLANKDR